MKIFIFNVGVVLMMAGALPLAAEMTTAESAVKAYLEAVNSQDGAQIEATWKAVSDDPAARGYLKAMHPRQFYFFEMKEHAYLLKEEFKALRIRPGTPMGDVSETAVSVNSEEDGSRHSYVRPSGRNSSKREVARQQDHQNLNSSGSSENSEIFGHQK